MSKTRILPLFGGGGLSPDDVYTKEQVDALIADFITNTVDDLVHYYDKSDTYTKAEVQQLVGQITSFEVVATLPVSDIKTNVIYLLGPIGSGADRYEEYIYSNSTWTKIGETSVDLSNYITVNQLNTALGFYTTTQQLNILLAGKQDTLTPGTGITIGTDGTISADIPTLATVATTGDYEDLTNKPTIPVVPTLATVATSGSYNDLTDKPNIPVVPTLATVATTGAYSDLTGTPTIPTVGTAVITFTQGSATIGTFGVNDSTNKTIDIPAEGDGKTDVRMSMQGSTQAEWQDLYDTLVDDGEWFDSHNLYIDDFQVDGNRINFGPFTINTEEQLIEDENAQDDSIALYGTYFNFDNGSVIYGADPSYIGYSVRLLKSNGTISQGFDNLTIKNNIELSTLAASSVRYLYNRMTALTAESYIKGNDLYYNGYKLAYWGTSNYVIQNDALVYDPNAPMAHVFELANFLDPENDTLSTEYAVIFSNGTIGTTYKSVNIIGNDTVTLNFVVDNIGTVTYNVVVHNNR